MQEIKNITRILEETLIAIKKEDIKRIKELSDETIHSASTGDENSVIVGVIIYSLSKILSRSDYRTLKGWKTFNKITISALKNSIDDLKKEDEKKFRQDFLMIKKAINKISGKLKKYIEDVFKKAEINKASRIHEHGISLEKTAKMMGITLYDLQNYSGQTGISNVNLNKTIDVKTRINYLEEIFNE